jgi:hypothetical protein
MTTSMRAQDTTLARATPAVDNDHVGGLGALGKGILAGEILAAYTRTRILLKRHDTPTTIRLLRGRPRVGGRQRVRDAASCQALGLHLGWATALTLARLRLDDRCLFRSLVVCRLLSRRGVGHDVVFSVRGGVDGDFESHCWVEVSGRPVLQPGSPQHVEVMRL